MIENKNTKIILDGKEITYEEFFTKFFNLEVTDSAQEYIKVVDVHPFGNFIEFETNCTSFIGG